MSKFTDAINNQKGILVKTKEDRKKNLADKIKKEYSVLLKEPDPTIPGIANLDAEDKCPNQCQDVCLPSIRYGIKTAKIGDLNLYEPQLLPSSGYGAVFIAIKDESKSDCLMQQLAVRHIMSLRPGLCCLHLAEARFGTLSSSLKGIKHEAYRTPQKVEELIGILNEYVAQRTMQLSGKHICEYNNHSEAPLHYHFVWIDDWSEKCMSSQSKKQLLNIIGVGNPAAKGIHIFIRTQENPVPDELKQKCFVIEEKMPENSGLKLDITAVSSACLQTVAKTLAENGNEKQDYRRYDDWANEIFEQDRLCKSDAKDGISIPIGYSANGERFSLGLGEITNDYHGFLAGKTGAGKSKLLQTIATQICLHYSPEEVQLYLLDFGGGSTFGVFEGVPHVPVIMELPSPTFAVDTFNAIKDEMDRRDRLYQDLRRKLGYDIVNLVVYREKVKENPDLGFPPLPRILVVVEECQVLFPNELNGMGRLMSEASSLLTYFITQGRRYGVSVLLCTQVIGQTSIPATTKNQLSCRMSLKLNVLSESDAILGGRADATKLDPQGHLYIINNNNVSEIHNVWCGNYTQHLERMKQHLEKNKDELMGQVVLHGNEMVLGRDVIEKNPTTETNFTSYLGLSSRLREEPSFVKYKSNRKSENTLMIGTDTKTAVRIIGLTLFQAVLKSPQGCKVYIIDATQVGDESYGSFKELETINPDWCTFASSVEEGINEIKAEYDRRRELLNKKENANNERIIVPIFNIQHSQALGPQETGPMSMKSPLTRTLTELLPLAPSVNIHFIVHADGIQSLFDDNFGVFRSSEWHYFSHKIILNGVKEDEFRRKFIDEVSVPAEGYALIMGDEQYETCHVYSLIDSETKTTTDNEDKPKTETEPIALENMYNFFFKHENI